MFLTLQLSTILPLRHVSPQTSKEGVSHGILHGQKKPHSTTIPFPLPRKEKEEDELVKNKLSSRGLLIRSFSPGNRTEEDLTRRRSEQHSSDILAVQKISKQEAYCVGAAVFVCWGTAWLAWEMIIIKLFKGKKGMPLPT